MTNALATSLGLSTYNSGSNTNDDATITLNSNDPFNFDPTKGGVVGEYPDTATILEHEISVVMGRQFGSNNSAGNGLLPEPLALFRTVDEQDVYTGDSIGGHFLIPGVPNAHLLGEQNGDLADWGDTSDDVDGYGGTGVAQYFTPADVQVMRALGWSTSIDDDWTGGTASWSVEGDWTDGVPNLGSDVFIPQGDPEIAAAVKVNSLTVESGATLSTGGEISRSDRPD